MLFHEVMKRENNRSSIFHVGKGYLLPQGSKSNATLPYARAPASDFCKNLCRMVATDGGYAKKGAPMTTGLITESVDPIPSLNLAA